MVWFVTILVLFLLALIAYKYFLPSLEVTEMLEMESKDLFKKTKSKCELSKKGKK